MEVNYGLGIRKLKCLICSAEGVKSHMLGDVKLINCPSCDIFYLKDIPSEEVLKKYYEDSYEVTSSMIESERRRIFRLPEQVSLISEIKQYVISPATLLDIGCDKGYFLDEARRYGFKTEGVEPSKKAREYCQNIGIKVYASLDEVDGKYDAITLWHSLEHHRDPLKTLNSIKKYLAPGGYIFIRVPDFSCFWSSVLGRSWMWFQPNNHYFHFTPKAITKLLEVTGYSIIKMDQRKPNNNLTKRMNYLSNSIFSHSFNSPLNFKNKISCLCEDLTCVEIFGIGRFSVKNKKVF